MVEKELGRATIVYEHPREGTVERTVQNEHLAYFQDHWIVKQEDGEAGTGDDSMHDGKRRNDDAPSHDAHDEGDQGHDAHGGDQDADADAHEHGVDEEGHDVVRRIPVQRVHYVDRTVDEFEAEVSTLKNQVQSFADDLRTKFLGGREERERGTNAAGRGESESVRIDVDSADTGDETSPTR